MERALDISVNWAVAYGLTVNPEIAEICIFTRKTKISQFNPLPLRSKTIAPLSSAKYFGVVFDKRNKLERTY